MFVRGLLLLLLPFSRRSVKEQRFRKPNSALRFTNSRTAVSFRGCATKEATGSIVFTALILRNETAEAFLFSVDLIPRRKGPREVSVSSSGEGGVKYSVT